MTIYFAILGPSVNAALNQWGSGDILLSASLTNASAKTDTESRVAKSKEEEFFSRYGGVEKTTNEDRSQKTVETMLGSLSTTEKVEGVLKKDAGEAVDNDWPDMDDFSKKEETDSKPAVATESAESKKQNVVFLSNTAASSPSSKTSSILGKKKKGTFFY